MNFQQLEYIIAVDKHRHFAKAADSCFVTQATLSAMIKKLEEELNIIIFDRSRQPVIPTEQGKEVLEFAREIIFQQNELLEFSADTTKSINGDVIIGIIPTIANTLLPLVLKPILEKYPDLNLTIVEITTEEIITQLDNEHIDMGILATPLNIDSLEENILYYEAMMVYGVQDEKKKYVLPEDLENDRVWLLEEGHCFRSQAITICNIKEKTNQPSNFRFEGSSFETLLNLTDQFGGYTLVPELYYNQMPEHRKKKTKHFEIPFPVREVSIVYDRPYAKKFIIEALTNEIIQLIKGKLTTQNQKAKNLSIIGI